MRPIEKIVIHCADTPNGKPFSIQDIDRWHFERGFRRTWIVRQHFNEKIYSCGYHFVIDLDGKTATGRHVNEVGAHARGENSKSLGICLIGSGLYTVDQWIALSELVRDLLKKFPGAAVVGHRDLNGVKKSCPCFDVSAWLAGNYAALFDHLFTRSDYVSTVAG